MVSLGKLSHVDEEGVTFQSPYAINLNGDTNKQSSKGHSGKVDELLMTPEKSVEIQTSLGADIMMQLDDVVHVLTKGQSEFFFAFLIICLLCDNGALQHCVQLYLLKFNPRVLRGIISYLHIFSFTFRTKLFRDCFRVFFET